MKISPKFFSECFFFNILFQMNLVDYGLMLVCKFRVFSFKDEGGVVLQRITLVQGILYKKYYKKNHFFTKFFSEFFFLEPCELQPYW